MFHLVAGDGLCGCGCCLGVCFVCCWLGCLLCVCLFLCFARAPSPPAYISYEDASHSGMGT